MNTILVSTLLFACVTLAHGSVLGDVNAAGYQSNKPSESSDKSSINGGLTGVLLGDGLADSVNVLGAQVDQKSPEKTTKNPLDFLFRAPTLKQASPNSVLLIPAKAPIELDIGLL